MTNTLKNRMNENEMEWNRKYQGALCITVIVLFCEKKDVSLLLPLSCLSLPLTLSRFLSLSLLFKFKSIFLLCVAINKFESTFKVSNLPLGS